MDDTQRHLSGLAGVTLATVAALTWVLTGPGALPSFERIGPAIAMFVVGLVFIWLGFRNPDAPSLAADNRTAGPASLDTLADLSDIIGAQILTFEHREPDGSPIPFNELSLSEQFEGMGDITWIPNAWARFEAQFGADLRSVFSEVKKVGLVTDDDADLFYHPRQPHQRVELALVLKHLARQLRDLT